jgi:polyisoprenyl-phosphate glycosyltransferase
MSPRVVVITPVYNDWECFRQLLFELDAIAPTLDGSTLSVVAVDDGSERSADPDRLGVADIRHLASVEVVRLICNLGHQRAIAVGLARVNARADHDAVVVMDCDGEDQPGDVPRLLQALREEPGRAVMARRAHRSEGFLFRSLYALYKRIFRVLTGQRISFGNFSAFPSTLVDQLVNLPEIWNNLAAGLTRSQLPFRSIPTNRGVRFAGSSKLNLTSLVIHGLSAVSVYTDVVFVRVLLFSLAVAGVTLIGLAAVVGIRLFTDLAIPGWASTVGGILSIMLVQVLILSSGAIFLLLHNRSSPSVIPARAAADYVKAVAELIPHRTGGA